MAETGELTELGRDECLRLLAGGVVGRVVFTEAALPAAHPVTYLLDGDEIVFCTANGGKLARRTRSPIPGVSPSWPTACPHPG